jgi:hypothetical protein
VLDPVNPKSICYPSPWKRDRNRRVVDSTPDEVIFSIYLILLATLGRGIYSASNRNEYRKHKNNASSCKAQPVRRASKLTDICEQIF